LTLRYLVGLYGIALWGMILFASVAAAAEDVAPSQTWSVSLGAEYSSGDLGEGATTRSTYLPLQVTWFPTSRLDVGVEVPFLIQSGPGGSPRLYSMHQGTSAKVVARRGPGMGMGSGGGGQNTETGLGDIILRLGMIVLPEGESLPQVRPSLYVKCPTASKSRGLGTGEFDAGMGVEVVKWLGSTVLTGEAIFNYQGRASDYGLTNYFSYSAGAGYQFSGGLQPMVQVKGGTSPSDFSGQLLEARARLYWTLTRSTAVDLFVAKGLADSSPDYGGGLAVQFGF
jgi:hypothetical protein